MYYDSMICKLIVHGPDRHAAIARMREALDAFVIRGISSNIPFQAALLAHPDFVAGRFNTGFIAEHYPKGFTLASVKRERPELLLALAAATNRRLLERAAGITGQLAGHEFAPGEDFVIVETDGQGQRTSTPVTVRCFDGHYVVGLDGRTHTLRLDGQVRDIAVHGEFDGAPFCAQVERLGLPFQVTHGGAQITVRVLSPRAAELYALMPFKAPPDLSRYLLSPMPGLLVDVAVAVGQPVRAGEKLAVIEAMKMENILLASQDGVVKEIKAAKGDTLAVDQVIMEFQ
jgi:propionyl-CoA carboxylase alpha chain